MAQFHEVDPQTLIDTTAQTPANGRGAFSREGIDIDYRFRLAPAGTPTVGTQAEKSLAYWAVSAGVYAVQQRLTALGYYEATDNPDYHGRWGSGTDRAYRAFQHDSADPSGGARLVVDGTMGRSDSRAMWTPVIDEAEARYNIPNHYLRGQTAWESGGLDCAAVGYYIYYAVRYRKDDGTYGTRIEYRGVDRGLSQINSVARASVTWAQAYDPNFALDASAKDLRSTFDAYKKANPDTPTKGLWEAALCHHNNPSAGSLWAKTGMPPTDTAASYVNSVLGAIY